KRNPLRVRDVDFLTARTGYLLDETGRLWLTQSGGSRWTEIAATGSDDALGISFGAQGEGWLTPVDFADPSSAFVLRTSDGGRTWRPQRLSVGTPAPDGLVAGTGRQAYALTFLRGGPGAVQQRQLFGTATGGDAGTASQ